MEFSERAEILLLAGENATLKFNRKSRLGNFLLSKILPARKIPQTGNCPYGGLFDQKRIRPPLMQHLQNEKEIFSGNNTIVSKSEIGSLP